MTSSRNTIRAHAWPRELTAMCAEKRVAQVQQIDPSRIGE
jgi:hypothetical protein